MDFIHVPKKNRPIPFWSWNDTLQTEETKRQIGIMDHAGMGGFFMHARAGLITDYMGEEWFENIEVGIRSAKERGMYAWAYDENGWPSGFGGGIVNGKGEQNQQKYLRYDNNLAEDSHTICIVDGKRFYYDVNPYYVDTLDGRVTEEFIQNIYEPYYQKFGNELTGFFTDEPQISRNGIPWSLILPEAYRTEYGDDICARLPELFFDTGDYIQTRMRFWRLITKLFSENFMKKLYDWCTERGLQLTGHLVLEETFLSQLTSSGAVMPHYEYFTIPGMDNLGRIVNTNLTPYQVGSAAQQLGKKQVLSETFAMCGHNVSFEELKRIYEHQMARGVTLLCQHLEGYTMRGARKRDYPPAMFYQQPWWNRYQAFCEGLSRIGMILENGRCECDTLLMHPQTSAWIMFNTSNDAELDAYYSAFKEIVLLLDRKHVSFHLGDEMLMERHGYVDGNRLVIGEMSYKTVVVPLHIRFFSHTEKLLKEFEQNGGLIISPEQVAEQTDVIDNPEVYYTKRSYDDFDVYYFVNSTEKMQRVKFFKGTERIDISTGKTIPFEREYCFAPCESMLVIDKGGAPVLAEKKALKPLKLAGDWNIKHVTPNVLTLDRCDYYFDGVCQETKGYVLNIQGRANALKRPVQVKQVFTVMAEDVCSDLCLVCETPAQYKITVNGQPVLLPDEPESFIDTSFKKIPIARFMVLGENTICLECTFSQRKETYEALDRAKKFEGELNKLYVDMELEPCYLIGHFGVRMDGKIENLEREALRFDGDFVLTEMPEKISLEQIERQGFPFFAGVITLEKEFSLEDTDHKISFSKKGINAIDITVNGELCKTLLWTPFEADISPQLHCGCNVIELTLYNNLRNMMGPHHLEEGECYATWPGTFFKESDLWFAYGDALPWNDAYCFAEVSVCDCIDEE